MQDSKRDIPAQAALCHVLCNGVQSFEETGHRVCVVFTKNQTRMGAMQKVQGHAVKMCSSFDDLLELLEKALVAVLFLDQSLDRKEIQSVIAWTRIFDPNVKYFLV